MKKIRVPILLCCFLLVFTISACSASQVDTSGASPTEPKYISPTKMPSTEIENLDTEQTIEADAEFSSSTFVKTAPDDILTEIHYYGGGGGRFCTGSENKPEITYEPRDEELMTLSTLIACGWDANEILSGVIHYPNGKRTTQIIPTGISEGVYYGKLAFKPSIDDPPGDYIFELEGKKGKVEAVAHFSNPVGPRLFQLDDTHLFLHGFTPNENVRLFLFGNSGLVGWQKYRVKQDGQLTIKYIDNTKNTEFDFLIAIGDQSGEAHLKYETPFGTSFDLLDKKIIQKQYCGNLYSRLTVTRYGRVTYTDGANMSIREKPGFSQEILYSVPEGTRFIGLDGPICTDNVFWWKVLTMQKLEGWMAEYQDGVYLLEPIQ